MKPAEAKKPQMVAAAKGAASKIVEEGKASATAIRSLGATHPGSIRRALDRVALAGYVRAMRWTLVLLATACGAATPSTPPPSTPPPPAAAAGPTLLGRAVAVAPLTTTQDAAFARATTSLAQRAPALDGDMPTWRATLRAWIEQRSGLLRELDAALHALPAAEREGLFASIVGGVAFDDLVEDILALPMPPVAKDPAFAAELERAYRESLEQLVAPLATTARQRLQRCHELAATGPASLRGWSEHCQARVAVLAALGERVAARPAAKRASPAPRALEDCGGSQKLEAEPDGLPPDRATPPRAVVLYSEGYDGVDRRVTGAARARLLAAVRQQLQRTTKLTLLSAKDVAAGEALVAGKRMRAGGPVCGQPPRLSQVLSAKHRHLVVARVSPECTTGAEGDERCGLHVWFTRAGTRDRDGLPAALYAEVDRDEPARWIAAVSKLSTQRPTASVLGALLGSSSEQVLRLTDHGDDDPWMRLGETLQRDTEAKLAACVDAAASYDVALTISPTGATTAVALTPITAPAAGSRVETCVREALRGTAFPCTRDGKPIEVAFRACVAPRSR